MEKLPWLDYTGQSTGELIACRNTHLIDSLLVAFEEGIQGKLAPRGKRGITAEEELVLAVMALNREVNNGGYHQFFLNSSRNFVPMIVSCLHSIGCATTAAITEKAIAALRLENISIKAISAAIRARNAERDKVLDACDNEFYKLDEITPRLFEFVEAHQDQIRLIKASLPKRWRPKVTIDHASTLYWHLVLLKKKEGMTLESARQIAKDYAGTAAIPATDAEIERAAILFAFGRAVQNGDLAACEELAPGAFELARENPMHCIQYFKWVEQLLGVTKQPAADAWTLRYLEYVKSCDPSDLRTQNLILYWAALLQKHRAVLTRSVEFYVANFPEDDLDQPLPKRRFEPLERPRKTDPA
jgi:hypothetical protein